MSADEIRLEYIRLLEMADEKQRLEQLRVLQEHARSCGELDWSKLIEAGIAKFEGNSALEVEVCTGLIENSQTVADQRFWAYLARGAALGEKGDWDAEIADCTAVIEDPNAPVEQKAMARFSRGVAFDQDGDIDEAIEEYTVVIDDPDAPAEQKAKARINRGVAFGRIGGTEAALADFNALIADPTGPPKQRALARVDRGYAFEQEGDPEAAIAEYTFVIDDPDAPAGPKALARVYRGVSFCERGDVAAAIADHTDVIDDPAAPARQKVMARINRGLAFDRKGDSEAAIVEFDAVIDDLDAPAELRALARFNRGIAFGQNGDTDAEIADYTALIADPDAPAEHKMDARLNRAIAFGKSGDRDAEIADYTALINDPDAPAEELAQARLNRGIALGQTGDTDAEIADYTALIDDPDAPAEEVAHACLNRGITFGQEHKTGKAIDDFRAVFNDSEASAIERSKAQMYWMLLSQDPSGKSLDAAKDLVVELDGETKKEFQEKLHTERERKIAFFSESQFNRDCSFLLVAREWNSFTPAVPELGEPSRGGGYYLRHHGVGIVVDPGFDFLQIFAQAGGRLCDIDHVVITHAHNDHTAEFEAILTLLYAYNNPGPDEPERPQKKINVYLNQGAARKFAGMLPLRDSKEIRKVVTLSRGSKDHPFVIPISEDEDILLTVLPAYHDDVLTVDSAVGLGFRLRRADGSFRHIVFTGDTALFSQAKPSDKKPHLPVYEAYPEPYCNKKGCDLLIAHIGTITESDLKGALGVAEATSQTFLPSVSRQDNHPPRRTVVREQGSEEEPREEGKNHLRLSGVFAVTCGLQPKAAIVSEFGEEMKTIWIKAVRAIEIQLNKVVDSGISVFAGDPMLIYDIENGQFLCHEDQQFHDPQELRMVGIYEERDSPDQRHPRPYLFLKSGDKNKRDPLQFERIGKGDPSDYEDTIQEYHDKLRAFHDKWDNRDLPHFKPKPAKKADEEGQ